jgi:hypothetical protein
MTQRTFRTSYWPIPVFAVGWIVIVLIAVFIAAGRNGQAFSAAMRRDLGEILLYGAAGVLASVAVVGLGWTRVELGDRELILERLRELITRRKTVIPYASIQAVEERYSGLARSQVTAITLNDGRVVRIGHTNLINGSEFQNALKKRLVLRSTDT